MEEHEKAREDFLGNLRAQIPTHPSTNQCPDMECLICGMRDCPHGEPLHYHHDGCPACYLNPIPEKE